MLYSTQIFMKIGMMMLTISLEVVLQLPAQIKEARCQQVNKEAEETWMKKKGGSSRSFLRVSVPKMNNLLQKVTASNSLLKGTN